MIAAAFFVGAAVYACLPTKEERARWKAARQAATISRGRQRGRHYDRRRLSSRR